MVNYVPHKFWAEALSTAVFLSNRSYTSAVPGTTPLQAWSGKKPSVSNLIVFGCAAYSHIPKDERTKLSPKARRCIFLGYRDVTKGYRLYDPSKVRVIHSRDVIFDETSLGFEKEQQKDSAQSDRQLQPVVEINVNEEIEDQYQKKEIEISEKVNKSPKRTRQVQISLLQFGEPLTVPHRSERTRQRPDYYGVQTHMTKEQVKEPVTVKEAMSSPEGERWIDIDAMEKEMRSIEANEVWELVKLKRPLAINGFISESLVLMVL